MRARKLARLQVEGSLAGFERHKQGWEFSVGRRSVAGTHSLRQAQETSLKDGRRWCIKARRSCSEPFRGTARQSINYPHGWQSPSRLDGAWPRVMVSRAKRRLQLVTLKHMVGHRQRPPVVVSLKFEAYSRLCPDHLLFPTSPFPSMPLSCRPCLRGCVVEQEPLWVANVPGWNDGYREARKPRVRTYLSSAASVKPEPYSSFPSPLRKLLHLSTSGSFGNRQDERKGPR